MILKDEKVEDLNKSLADNLSLLKETERLFENKDNEFNKLKSQFESLKSKNEEYAVKVTDM